MKINSQIEEVLKETHCNINDSLGYLLALYYDIKPTYIPDEVKRKVHASGIITNHQGINWNIPLFEEQNTQFDWVKVEYIPLFTRINKEKTGHVSDCITRMKRFFVMYPDIRKDEILAATKLYLRNTDPLYIREPRYFVFKGVGADKTSDLAHWVEVYRETNKKPMAKPSLNNIMR